MSQRVASKYLDSGGAVPQAMLQTREVILLLALCRVGLSHGNFLDASVPSVLNSLLLLRPLPQGAVQICVCPLAGKPLLVCSGQRSFNGGASGATRSHC